MQPETPQQAMQGQEQAPVAPPVGGGEYIPSLPSLPERGIEHAGERKEQVAEASAAAANMAGMPQAVPQVPVVNDVSDPTQPVVSGPVTAADDDLIEKEWVDKSKEIVQTTKDDPYTRSHQVNQLQRDYLKKRYGKEIGAAE